MSAEELRASMVMDRTNALMSEKYPHDTAGAITCALFEIGEEDYRYLDKSASLGAERLGNAILNISFAYWERKAKEEAERQIAEQWDSCQCHGLGCKHCVECNEFEVSTC